MAFNGQCISDQAMTQGDSQPVFLDFFGWQDDGYMGRNSW